MVACLHRAIKKFTCKNGISSNLCIGIMDGKVIYVWGGALKNFYVLINSKQNFCTHVQVFETNYIKCNCTSTSGLITFMTTQELSESQHLISI